MTTVPDKELSDLLDFSAMFYPPVPTGADLCKGPNDVDVGMAGPGSTGPLAGHSFKTTPGMEAGNSSSHWNTVIGQTNNSVGYDSKVFEGGQVYHSSSSSGDVMSTFAPSDLQPAGKLDEDVFSRSYQNRNLKGTLSGNLPMSPSSSVILANARPPYFAPGGKRPASDDLQSGRAGGKFMPDPKRMKNNSVYSPSPDEYHHDPMRYPPSPQKLPAPFGLYGDYQPYPEAARNIGGGGESWSAVNGDLMIPSSYLSSMQQSLGTFSPVGPYSMPHRNNMNYSMMSSPSLAMPPLAAFHSALPPGGGGGYNCSSSMETTLEPGSSIGTGPHPQVTSQTGDALGKALASIYASDQVSNSFTSSPSSPVCSPPPLTGLSSHWSQSAGSSTSPLVKKTNMHSMQSRMEERLDDAIHVLRNHAEAGQLFPPVGGGGPGGGGGGGGSGPGMVARGGLLPPSHSTEMIGSGGSYESHYLQTMVIPASIPGHHTMPPCQSSAVAAADRSRSSQMAAEQIRSMQLEKPCSVGDSGSVKEESVEKYDFHMNSTDGSTRDSSVVGSSKTTSAKRSRRVGMLSSDSNDLDDMIDDDDDDDASPETKAQREKVRRQQNNARERLRVKDINEAIKELGQMISIHTGCRQPMTRLMIVQEAVNVITNLELKLKERNLNPKAACLKRREEEKAEELPGRSMLPPHQASATNKVVRALPCPGVPVPSNQAPVVF